MDSPVKANVLSPATSRSVGSHFQPGRAADSVLWARGSLRLHTLNRPPASSTIAAISALVEQPKSKTR
jgi:hypothetical protein